MKRVPSEARPNAAELVRAEGLTYAQERSPGGDVLPYWTETHAYELESAEVDLLERVTQELHDMSVAATVEMAKRDEVLRRLGLPELAWPAIRASVLSTHEWTLYGRLDLAYGDGCEVPKLLEYNADTPAGLVEAAVSQWSWVEALHPELDQWNMMHERLVQAWQKHVPRGEYVHLAAGMNEPLEDWNTIYYLMDTAKEAGLNAREISIEDVGFHEGDRAFVDTKAQPNRYISTMFKMYPWEWILAEEFGAHIAYGGLRTRFIEPLSKVLMGSKALLPVLWEMFPHHPNLLPAYFSDQAADLLNYVSKPVYGWEGAGIVIVKGDGVLANDLRHTEGQETVFQEYVQLPDYDGNHPVLGTWLIDGVASGLGIRESTSLITDTDARFLPHYINASRSTDEQVQSWLTEEKY